MDYKLVYMHLHNEGPFLTSGSKNNQSTNYLLIPYSTSQRNKIINKVTLNLMPIFLLHVVCWLENIIPWH